MTSLIFSYALTRKLSETDMIGDAEIWGNYLWRFSFLINLPCMALGIVLYYGYKRCFPLKKNNRILSICICLGSLYLLWCLATGFNDIGGEYYSGIPSLFLFSVGFAGIIISQWFAHSRFIDNKVMALIGKNSYGIYFVHYLIIAVLFQYINSVFSWLLVYIITIVLSLIFGIASRKYFEEPCAKIGMKLLEKII